MSPGCVPRCEQVRNPSHFHEFIDGDATEPVPLDLEEPGERIRTHACTPDHRRRRDHLARSQCYPGAVDSNDGNPGSRFDTKAPKGLFDHWTRAVSHVRPYIRFMIPENHPESTRPLTSTHYRLPFPTLPPHR